MIGVERLARILDVIGCTQVIGTPISVNLIAPSDSGKTRLMLAHLPTRARVLNDFTAASLLNTLSQPDRPQWIVVPDFNAVVGHRPAVATLTMAVLLSLMAEGVTEIPSLEGPAKLKAATLKKEGVTIALITGMTPEMMYSRRGRWRATGLLRRLLPIWYTYSAQTAAKIQQTIQHGEDRASYPRTNVAAKRRRTRTVINIPDKIGQQIQNLSEAIIVHQLAWRTGPGQFDGPPTRTIRALDYPFSIHKMLRTYVRAAAIREERTRVTQTDLDALIDFSKFLRYDRPEEL